MNGKWILYVSQFGHTVGARTVRELKERAAVPGKVSKMYVDKTDGPYHVGYVIGQHWFTAYAPVETKASF